MKYFLTGYMGCGKTTLGRESARRAGLAFVDLDRRIEQHRGLSVGEIFAHDGEEGFRLAESEMLRRVAAEPGDAVVATGGGTPCFGGNMTMMKAAGRTVYLRFSPARLATRLAGGESTRPILKGVPGDELPAFIAENLARREEFYIQADVVIDADGMSDAEIIDRLVGEFKKISDK